MKDHPELPFFREARDHFRQVAGDVPLLYTWAMDMLQELERQLAVAAFLRQQTAEIEEGGLDAADPDLWSDEFDLLVDRFEKRKNFQAKITAAVDNWSVAGEGQILAAIQSREFAHLDRSKIGSFKDLFHMVRHERNHLAHKYFLDHATTKTSPEGVRRMESELTALIIDLHFVGGIANSLAGGLAAAVNQLVADLIDKRDAR